MGRIKDEMSLKIIELVTWIYWRFNTVVMSLQQRQCVSDNITSGLVFVTYLLKWTVPVIVFCQNYQPQ